MFDQYKEYLYEFVLEEGIKLLEGDLAIAVHINLSKFLAQIVSQLVPFPLLFNLSLRGVYIRESVLE
jgi:hypothetical protein